MDWNAGVPAYNVAFFSDVTPLSCRIIIACSFFALMQARMPAVQSVDDFAVTTLDNKKNDFE